jgi:hypothetical protein
MEESEEVTVGDTHHTRSSAYFVISLTHVTKTSVGARTLRTLYTCYY